MITGPRVYQKQQSSINKPKYFGAIKAANEPAKPLNLQSNMVSIQLTILLMRSEFKNRNLWAGFKKFGSLLRLFLLLLIPLATFNYTPVHANEIKIEINDLLNSEQVAPQLKQLVTAVAITPVVSSSAVIAVTKLVHTPLNPQAP